MNCPACGTGYSSTCLLCRERTFRLTPLKILGGFSWKVHVLAWDSPLMEGMTCVDCGKRILPEMTMRELTGPCSGRRPEMETPP